MKKVFFLLLLVLTEAKVFNRCELARTLKAAGMDGYRGVSLADWVCMTKHQSNYNTRAIKHNDNGSTNFGIFQINNRYWCFDGKFPSHNKCGMSCAELRTKDISKAIRCAMIIVEKQGMKAWYGWSNHCTGRDIRIYIKGCGVDLP